MTPFFDPSPSRFGKAALDRGRWGSWKYYFESVMSWEAARRLHVVIPAWRRIAFEREIQVLYRSVRTGGLRAVSRLCRTANAGRDLPPTICRREDKALSDTLFPSQLVVHSRLRRKHGATRNRHHPHRRAVREGPGSVDLTKRLSQATGVPYVEAWPLGLRSQAARTWMVDSAIQFADALFEALRRHPTFLEVAGAAK